MFVTQGSLQEVWITRGPPDVGVPRPEHRNVQLICWLVTFNIESILFFLPLNLSSETLVS